MHCILCNSNEVVVVQKNGAISLLSCGQCGLFSISPLPGPDEIVEFYRHDYGSVFTKDERRHFAKHAEKLLYYRLKLIFSTLRTQSQLKHISKSGFSAAGAQGKKLLDVGCGVGSFLFILSKKGWHTAGVELNPFFTAKLKTKLPRADIIEEDFEIHDFKNDKFDLITMSHSFEHFARPLEVLRKAKSMLSRDGIFFVEIPNSQHPLCRPRCRDLEHVYFYVPKTIQTLLTNSGFHVKAVTTLDPLENIIGSHVNKLIKACRQKDPAGFVSASARLAASSIRFTVNCLFRQDTARYRNDGNGLCIRILAAAKQDRP